MSDFDIKFGPWINYGNSNKQDEIKEKMNNLVTAVWSPFNGQDRSQVFIFCMSYGFGKGMEPIKPPPAGSGSMPASAFDKEMRDLMKFVAIANNKNFEVATDAKEVVRICEGFAYAAFLHVYDKITNRNSKIQPEEILEKLIQEVSK